MCAFYVAPTFCPVIFEVCTVSMNMYLELIFSKKVTLKGLSQLKDQYKEVFSTPWLDKQNNQSVYIPVCIPFQFFNPLPQLVPHKFKTCLVIMLVWYLAYWAFSCLLLFLQGITALPMPAHCNKYQFTIFLLLKTEKLSVPQENAFQKTINLYNVVLRVTYESLTPPTSGSQSSLHWTKGEQEA